MAYSANIVTVAEMQFYAGENVDTTGDTDANHTILQDHAEAYLSTLLKFNLDAAGFATLSTPNKEIISEWAARFAANALIKYNMAGYSTIVEAEDMINLNLYRMEKIEELLKQADIQDFQGS